MYEAETEVPHFLYYEASKERVNLFKFIIDLELGEGRGDDHSMRKTMIEEASMTRITNDIAFKKEDRMRMRPASIIEERGLFEPENDADRRVWDDKKNFRILNAVYQETQLLMFSATNCYKVPRNKNGKFG